MSSKFLNICQSKLKESKSTFVWMIEHFSDHKTLNLESGIFKSLSPSAGHMAEWILHLFFNNGHFGIGIPSLEISINRVDSAATEIRAKIKFMIRNSEAVDEQKLLIPNQIYAKNPDQAHYQCHLNKLIGMHELLNLNNGFLPEDKLTIVFEVTIFGESLMEMRSLEEFEIPKCHGMEDMGTLFVQGLFTDCTLVADDGTKFEAHKAILACRSPVFKAMFTNEMVEANEGIVKINNIRAPVLEQMLHYMYSGKAPKLEEMAMELFQAADQYEFDRLKILCERELATSLESENACELLVMADLHSAKYLKTYVIKYILKHTKEVMDSDGWKMLIKGNHMELMGEIVKAIAEAK